jgi:anti-anti-sigma factor
MNYDVEELPGNVAKVNLGGRLDVAGANAIDLKFNVLVGSRRAIVVDLSQVSFIASMGLRTLIMGARTAASKRGKIVLFAPQKDVEQVLVSSGADQMMQIVHDLDAARAAVAG